MKKVLLLEELLIAHKRDSFFASMDSLRKEQQLDEMFASTNTLCQVLELLSRGRSL